MVKTIEEYFSDWESHVFGFGYGSGEEYTIPAVRRFLLNCNEGDYGTAYDYINMEKELTPTVAWLLINTLAHTDIIEYGCSPRYAWLTKKGERLKEFMLSHTDEQLIALSRKSDDICSPTACICGEHGYEEGRICQNPFWMDVES